MRLKNLTVKGFKSFANETSLNFNDDVIGVVGPNGSGKSNVVDAIRWVLGEQKSRELRLEKMSDIIFNGTKKRKEASTAQVTLTFENNKGILPVEYQNVAVSRILYRSGESEYRLNGVTCRLKDIMSLLMDTGIGSNSYAIIALGMVDDILSDKENARRRMFEQAAGISKYKKRKRETLNKLKGTTADLDRVEDLLFEIEGNLKSLEKQAKRAKKYLDLKEQYKELSIQFAHVSIQSLKEEYKRLGTALKSEQDVYSGLDAEIRKKEALLEKGKKGNLEQEQSLSAKQRELNELVTRIRTIESEKSLLEQKQKFKESNAKTLKSAVAATKLDLERFDSEVKSLKKRLKKEEENKDELLEDVAKFKKKYEAIKGDHQNAKQAFDAQVLEREKLNKSIFDLEKQLALISNNETNIKEDLKRGEQSLEGRKNEYKDAKSTLEKIQKEIDSKQKKLEILTKAEEDRKSKVQDLEAKQEEVRLELVKVTRTIDSKQNEFDLLKSMIDNYEGFPESIKFLSTNWKKDVPVLSDLLDVAEGYKGVIEQFLSPYLNYYVVENLEEAKTAIDLLANSQKGKANFFLLDQIDVQKFEALTLADTIPAFSKVVVDSKYDNLLKFLLKDVLIYEGAFSDFDYNVLPDQYTYLAKSGSFLKGKNYIGGGSVGLFEGKKIGRKKNLEKLSKDLSRLEESKNKYAEKSQAIKDQLVALKQTDRDQEMKKIVGEKTELERKQVGFNTRIDVYKQYKKEQKEKEDSAKLQLDELKSNSKALAKQLERTKSEINKLERKKGNETDLDQLNNVLASASQKYNEANIGSIQQQNLVSNLSKDLDFKLSRMHDLERRLKQDKIRRRDELESVEDIIKQIKTIENSLIHLYQTKKKNEDQLSDAEQSYYKARNSITEIEDEIRKITRNQNQIQLKVQQIRDNYTDVKFKISSVGERLKIEFGISINDIINEELKEMSMTELELEEKVERLKSRLGNYGDVNPMAVEAYNEMHDRFENISKQRADILEAKDSLLETIKEIESTAKEMFLKAFDEVRTNFIDVFRSLFSEEDNCNLILVDPDNPLDSPIEIIAKPKGKKPKSLSQLSGGEKTLTATALLFALYLLKPAPFCIFDEVDAPLDDANIQKFNKIIKKFSKKSQFIIVTHNKSTMSAVDILYGVYMQEQGVSSVTPVDFRNFKGADELQTIK
ncbi:MAG: chromosome segregation protein SMC [Saprospiraceae bacterium]|nr:chromosome segregation protein SMC [Saprospiraceae bacterium]